MKKNMFLRVASVLLVLTLLSTCAISGTFAKYVTKADTTDTARVAKWGVTITSATSQDLFTNTYKDPTNATVTVEATTDVVAPGTKGTFSSFNVTGTPEVSTKISYVSTVTIDDSWKDADGNYYCPITVKVNDVAVNAGTDAADFAKNIKAAIDAVTDTYAPNTNLSAMNADLAITWEWAYSTSEATDVKDTYLGNLDNAPTITIAVAATIEQVD